MLAPIVEELGKDYGNKITIGKVDVDANQKYAAQYGVRNIPTVLLFKGGEVIDKQVGVAPKKTYVEKIDALL
jgi:thioredoxin 1